jgi:hypothetical protein
VVIDVPTDKVWHIKVGSGDGARDCYRGGLAREMSFLCYCSRPERTVKSRITAIFKRGHGRTLDHIAVAIVAVSANLRRSQETCYLARMESNGQRDHLHLFSSFVA